MLYRSLLRRLTKQRAFTGERRLLMSRSLNSNQNQSCHSNSLECPLIVISGCTGTGKSELGIAIAKQFNGEVVNADSMQCYRGLDIATNKLTMAEMDGVPHHLIGFLDPFYTGYNVQDFRQSALDAIKSIWESGKLPILVGGTGYYIESVVFENNLIETDREKKDEIRQHLTRTFPTSEELYQELQRVDPETALELHKNNPYRVLRALEIYHSTGKRRSEYREKQLEKAEDGSHFGSTLRFPNTLLVNLDAEKPVLAERLETRVDKMLENGLLEELVTFYDQFRHKLPDFGIMQSIGLKEFLPYLQLDAAERETKAGRRMLTKCTRVLRIRNRQYAQLQRKWFYNRILIRGDYRQIPTSIALNTSIDFHSRLVPFTLDLVQLFLTGQSIEALSTSPSAPLMPLDRKKEEQFAIPNYVDASRRFMHCDVCELDIQGCISWEAHLKGKRHRKQLAAVKKEEEKIIL